jgi:putative ABC transport system permease protein
LLAQWIESDRRMMQTLLVNLRNTLRRSAASPGLTAAILLTIALGIGVNTAIFTVSVRAA